MNGRRLMIMLLLSCAALTLPAEQQQQPGRPPDRPYDKPTTTPYDEIVRFEGTLTARGGPLAGARVSARHLKIRNGVRVEIPHAGFLIVQVRAGEVFVTIGSGARRQVEPDEFFTVAPGERLVVETDDDSAVLHTVDTADRGR